MSDITDTITWKDPPPSRRMKDDPRWNALREHPGRWCVWDEHVQSSFGQYVKRSYPDFEIATRDRHLVDGKFRYVGYVRFIGEQTDGPGTDLTGLTAKRRKTVAAE